MHQPGGAHDPAPGLRALADLVNDALSLLGTRPAFALGPRGADLALSIPTDTSAPPSAPPSGLRARASRALQQPEPVQGDPGPGQASFDKAASDKADRADPDPSGSGVESEHAETWSLVHLAQQGDGEAFGLLYDRYVDQVFRFIYYRVNDRALAEDFTSETFLRALRRISSIKYQGRDIGAWFVTIARNIVLDHVKSARNRLEVTTDDTFEGTDTTESTESAVLTSLDSERLMAAVGELGDEQRDCVTLRFVQGLSVHETAAVMGKNDGAIKALQHRAVRKLATIIGDTF